ncbi:MAG TPA: sugar phosphate isomerase/epimerase family protein [Candidatus Acidoferrales bacterium]|jgi:sugar phosphate isomerase/epimerase|nr:sugar phosphate isomerase/epimerase family protein [Candidatus Acidoferrales bacterium]
MNRREFLQTAAGAGAALGLANGAAAAGTGMFISLNNTLLNGKVQWPESARLAAKVGYGGTDINLAAAMKEGQDATKALLTELKLKPSFANLPVNAARGDEDAFQKGMETLDDQVKFAAAIGCSRMMVVMPPATQTPKEELRQTLKRRFEAVGAVLSRHNVRCGLEFLGPLQFRQRAPHEFIWQMNEMVDFAKECGPSFGVVLDVWHWYHSGATLPDIRRAGNSRIVLLHLSDAAKQAPEDVRDNQRLMAGEGVIDLVGIFKTLREMGWEGSVSPEPLGRIPKEMSAEDGAKLGLETAQAVMRKAGIDI